MNGVLLVALVWAIFAAGIFAFLHGAGDKLQDPQTVVGQGHHWVGWEAVGTDHDD